MSRPIRNPTQVRSILANLALSIEESRARRMGSAAANNVPATRSDPVITPAGFITAPAVPQRAPTPIAPTPPTPRTIERAPTRSSTGSSGVSPPLRTQGEMFNGGVPRLKAQPKRPS
ncbi:MAG: hypothetical protein EXS10_05880 [Phycisphaerales bacterium]|nr:hypothetical protein [Phycisphaerales bacterium]